MSLSAPLSRCLSFVKKSTPGICALINSAVGIVGCRDCSVERLKIDRIVGRPTHWAGGACVSASRLAFLACHGTPTLAGGHSVWHRAFRRHEPARRPGWRDARSQALSLLSEPAAKERLIRGDPGIDNFSEVVLNLGSAACPAAAQRCRPRLTEPLWQLASRYRRPPPILGHCRGRAERRARRCGAGSGFYSARGTIAPTYGRPQRLLDNNITAVLLDNNITAVLPRPYCTNHSVWQGQGARRRTKKSQRREKR